ncbi:hypothetical protein DPMN_164834 [Dreissena polymorpha]|uniref:Uncharacterized protein n=1 Tax=Dreissena polymorpha TaxID=45954 RepID=A0A9D4IU24_DREPO|nr:hypothetical protein DPMN_164834 [Dreissena polymorpha]
MRFLPCVIRRNANLKLFFSVHEVNWHTIEEQQQKELIQEVSELLHRRLVTSTLQGEFRNIIELHVQVRLS